MSYDFDCNLELICTSEFSKKYQKLTSPHGQLNLNFLKNHELNVKSWYELNSEPKKAFQTYLSKNIQLFTFGFWEYIGFQKYAK